MSQQLVPQQPRSATALDMIDKAIEKGFSTEQLQQLIGMQSQMEDRQAAREYADALTGFARDCPMILKAHVGKITSAKGENSSFSYQYASYDDIMGAIAPILAAHRIVVSFEEPSDNAQVKRIVIILRVGTHVESRTFNIPAPPPGFNATQAFGSWLSYAKRYSLTAALNIAGTDRDNDAAGLMDTLSPGQVKDLQAMILTARADTVRLLQWAKADSVENIPAKLFGPAMNLLKKKASERNARD